MANDMTSASASASIAASHDASLSLEVPSPAEGVETQATGATAHATMNEESPPMGASFTGPNSTDTASASATFTSASNATSHVSQYIPSPVETVVTSETNVNATSATAVGATVDDSTPTDAPFDAELARLGPVARAFLVSEGITDLKGFLSRPASSLAPALSKFLEHNTHKILLPTSTKIWIYRWRRDLLQRQKTLKEGVQGLHPTFEIFSGEVRSFFTTQSIVKPKDLLEHPSLGLKWTAWRLTNSLTAVSEASACNAAAFWRQSVKEQVVETQVTQVSTLNFDELARLGPLPQAFLVSQGILDVEGFLAYSANSLAPALAKFRVDNRHEKQPLDTLVSCLRRWRRDLLQRRETLKEEVQGLHPTLEIFDGTVRSFFTAKSISKPQDVEAYRGLCREWMAWRQENDLTTVKLSTAHRATSDWRNSVKEQVESQVTQVSTLNFDELARLGPVARAFFDSQGILDVEGFLAYSAQSLAPELAEFRADNGLEKYPLSTLERCIRRWRRDLLQRQETLTEEVQGLHPTFEIFDGKVRSFFTAKSISNPQDLAKYGTSLGREWMEWRQEKNLGAVHPTTANRATSEWRTSVKEQLKMPFPSGTTAVTRQEAETTAPVNPEQIQRPVKKRLRRKVAIRTSPWLLLGVLASAAATHAQERTYTTGASPSAAEEADGSAAIGDTGIDNSPPAQKRARLGEADGSATICDIGT